MYPIPVKYSVFVNKSDLRDNQRLTLHIFLKVKS